jgi:hypothetical protein
MEDELAGLAAPIVVVPDDASTDATMAGVRHGVVGVVDASGLDEGP